MRFAVLNPGQISLTGLASFPFARHYSGNLGWFLFLALLRCFSSGGSPHIPILFSIWYLIFNQVDCSIRTSADQYLLAIPRSFSQLTTSFIGSQCQGIRPALFLAWPSFSNSLFMLDFSCVWRFFLVVFFLPHNQLSLFAFVKYFTSCFPHAFLLCFIQFSRF